MHLHYTTPIDTNSLCDVVCPHTVENIVSSMASTVAVTTLQVYEHTGRVGTCVATYKGDWHHLISSHPPGTLKGHQRPNLHLPCGKHSQRHGWLVCGVCSSVWSSERHRTRDRSSPSPSVDSPTLPHQLHYEQALYCDTLVVADA